MKAVITMLCLFSFGLAMGQKKPASGIPNPFVGVWQLNKWTASQADGKLVYPFGEDALGRIIYDTNGNMMVEIMRKDRPKFASESPLQGTPDEIIPAYNGFIAYYGTYTVDSNAKQVVHHIEGSSFPNWTGQDQIRNYEFKKGELILQTLAIAGSVHTLVWKKLH